MGIPTINDSEWYLDEFAETEFEDERLKDRFFQLMSRFSANPGANISSACASWPETKAAYRFFDNDRVDPSEILASHKEKTVERIKEFETILAIQDTTYFNFDGSDQMRGLGKISTRNKQSVMGLVGHTTFAISSDGVPLGLLAQEIWARGKKRLKNYQEVAVEEKESFKWLKALEETRALTGQLGSRVVTVADREADVFELLLEALDNGDHFLIRACRDRALEYGKPGVYLMQHMKELPRLWVYEIEKDKRMRKLEIRQARLSLRIPSRNLKGAIKSKAHPIEVNVIYVSENEQSTDRIEWLLLTDLETPTKKSVIEKVDWYAKRWHIESWHKVLKSGCRVEECQLLERARLIRYLTVFSVIAWRIYFMTHYGRKNLSAKATEVLSDSEWKALCVVTNKSKTVPDNPPTLYEATRMIAQLGGFLARKGDGEPGPAAIWKGYKKLADYVVMWEAMQS